jgi:hypothetical protein
VVGGGGNMNAPGGGTNAAPAPPRQDPGQQL